MTQSNSPAAPQRTSLFESHLAAQGKMVDFAGWEMPIQYQSQLDEHNTVRAGAGMFDVAHMSAVDLHGPRTREFLRKLLANDVAKLKIPGKALYSTMLDDNGGVIDDLIVYAPTPEQPELWRVIVNCGTHDKDLAWMQAQAASFRVALIERTDLAMVAVQGPQARAVVHAVLPEHAETLQGLAVFQGAEVAQDWFVARTGYTGEAGYEVILPAEQAATFWQALLAAGVTPCGLGARDTLRLEAGMPLYGNDMNDDTSPLTSNLGWSIAWEHDFIGKSALLAEREAGVSHQLVGLVLEGRGVLRSHMRVVIEGVADGETTSGTFSPTLEKAIAFARVPVTNATHAMVDIRGKLLPAQIVKPVFARNGKALI